MTFGSFPNTHDLISLVYDSLFWSQASSDPEPWLAESAEPNDDFTEWTVTLRDDVLWHDGEPFTAADVAFSFEYYDEQRASSGRYAHHVFDNPAFTESEIIDDTTVVLRFAEPAPQFRIMPGADLPIIPEHIWEGVTDPSTATTDLPVGTGPFRVVEMVSDESYRLEANDDHFKGEPTVDVLDLVVIADPAAAFTALDTGDVDFVARSVPPELLDQFASGDEIQIIEGTKLESTQLYFNARLAPLDAPVLRKAISMAIDNEALVETVLLGEALPGADGFVNPDSPWARPDRSHDFDPEAAAADLESAGYVDNDGDGVREGPDGNPLEFNVLVSSFAPLDLRAMQLVSEQVAEIGVTLIPEPLDPAALRSARNPPEGGGIPTYEAYVATLETHAHVDPDSLYYFFHSPGDRGFGGSITGFTNPEFDAIAEEAAVADVDDRLDLFVEMQGIIDEEAPVVVFWYPDANFAFRPEAYSGWVADVGHGVFHKRSFLPEYVEAAAAQTDEETGDGEGNETAAGATDDGGSSSTGVVIAVIAAVALIGAGVLFARRRQVAAGAGYDDEE